MTKVFDFSKNGKDGNYVKVLCRPVEKNKENLRSAFENCDIYSDYDAFARLVIENIFTEWKNYDVAIIKQGDYTGDVIFFISADIEGSKNDIFLTELSYGSCSVCDTLMRAAESEERVEDFMRVALHFIQNMKHPFLNPYCPSKYDVYCR